MATPLATTGSTVPGVQQLCSPPFPRHPDESVTLPTMDEMQKKSLLSLGPDKGYPDDRRYCCLPGAGARHLRGKAASCQSA